MNRRVVGIQFNPWGQVHHYDAGELTLKPGDQVIAKIEQGIELGTITSSTAVESQHVQGISQQVIRLATNEDIRRAEENSVKKVTVLEKARALVKRYQLSMKLVDCVFSYEGGKLTFIFTADGRIDFRELVKDMARTFQKSIRLQQIGIRDETKQSGGIGPCGRSLCCGFAKDMGSITTDMARVQQVHNRGSDRISGACGRLMCCLSFESGFYEEAMKKFPTPDSQVKTQHGTGRVLSCNVIKKTVTVRVEKDIHELPLKEIKQL